MINPPDLLFNRVGRIEGALAFNSTLPPQPIMAEVATPPNPMLASTDIEVWRSSQSTAPSSHWS